MKVNIGEKIKVRIEIVAEVSSSEYEDTDSIIDELSQECDYNVSGTDNITVHDTELRNCQLI